MAASKRETQRQETRARLYRSALEVFREVGVVQARIEDITTRAGVSRASFYFHFPTKEHVIDALRVESEEAFAAALEALPDGAPLDRVFTTIAAALSARWSGDPRLFAEVGLLSLRRVTEDATGGDRAGVRRAMTARFGEATRAGAVADLLPDHTLADLFLAHMLVAGLGWAANPVLPLEAVIVAASGFFLHGVAPRAGSGALAS